MVNGERLKKFYKLWLPMYRVINKKMRADYRAAMPAVLERIAISDGTTVLDVGTGTGGLAGVFLEYTSRVTGIDFSLDMLEEARKEYGDKIEFINMAAHEMERFADDSFDLVVAAYCLHDMSPEYRLKVLEQMRRVAGERVVIFEIEKSNNPVVRLLEFMEGSFYKEFVESFDGQLEAVFGKVEKIGYSKDMGVYICDV